MVPRPGMVRGEAVTPHCQYTRVLVETPLAYCLGHWSNLLVMAAARPPGVVYVEILAGATDPSWTNLYIVRPYTWRSERCKCR
jgi:hypothetical protein